MPRCRGHRSDDQIKSAPRGAFLLLKFLPSSGKLYRPVSKWVARAFQLSTRSTSCLKEARVGMITAVGVGHHSTANHATSQNDYRPAPDRRRACRACVRVHRRVLIDANERIRRRVHLGFRDHRTREGRLACRSGPEVAFGQRRDLSGSRVVVGIREFGCTDPKAVAVTRSVSGVQSVNNDLHVKPQ